MKFAAVNLVFIVLWICLINILSVKSTSRIETQFVYQMKPDTDYPGQEYGTGGWPGQNGCCPDIPQEFQKSGSCPLIHPDIACEKCLGTRCYSDFECPGTQKCCCPSPSCGNGCEEAINVNQSEAGSETKFPVGLTD